MFRRALLFGALASAVVAETTLSVFMPGANSNDKFVGSLVGATSCTTTLAIACTAGGIQTLGTSIACNPSESAYVTIGPSVYEVSSHTDIDGIKATVVDSCSLDGSTSAVCSVSVSVSFEGSQTASQTMATLTGADVVYVQVPITAGATSKLGGSACTSSSASAASGNAAAPTGVVDVYKVLVVPAAALVAGALI